MAGDDWSRDEVEVTVATYFGMLQAELSGLRVNKARKNEQLRALLRGRSRGSVEFKHANISAVLNVRGIPYIDGYKPRFNFQMLLEQVVLEYLDVQRDFFDPLLDGPILSPRAAPDLQRIDIGAVLTAPPQDMAIPRTEWSPTAALSKIDFVRRDAANRELGLRGEEFVMEFERRRLHDGGRRDLASKVEWTARTRGDGAGYDIASFSRNGHTRLIEVKTTGLAKWHPFTVTGNEVRCSQVRPEEFHLYRVFNFGPDARLYILAGELSRSCHLDPTQFRAFVQSGGGRSQ